MVDNLNISVNSEVAKGWLNIGILHKISMTYEHPLPLPLIVILTNIRRVPAPQLHIWARGKKMGCGDDSQCTDKGRDDDDDDGGWLFLFLFFKFKGIIVFLFDLTKLK